MSKKLNARELLKLEAINRAKTVCEFIADSKGADQTEKIKIFTDCISIFKEKAGELIG
jgi:hypothetical protein|tara:strand:+ start:698 stop:871 length:174 start_codon:yes stop_codon:yes gene_type:complete